MVKFVRMCANLREMKRISVWGLLQKEEVLREQLSRKSMRIPLILSKHKLKLKIRDQNKPATKFNITVYILYTAVIK